MSKHTSLAIEIQYAPDRDRAVTALIGLLTRERRAQHASSDAGEGDDFAGANEAEPRHEHPTSR